MGRRHRCIMAGCGIMLLLTACGSATRTPTPPTPIAARTPTILAISGSSTPTAPAASPALPTPTPGSTTTPPTPVASAVAIIADRTALPSRTPDMTTGVQSDGWVLDRIETSESAGRVTLTLRFQPLAGQTGGPQADVWFEGDDTTYSIAVHGVRGSNLVLRPGDVTPLTVAPLRGYYALPVRDDTIFALVIVAARPSVSWSLSASDGPGLLRLTL